MNSTIDWSVEGPHAVNCNCDYGCPCQFMALPTDGTCKAVIGFRVDKGHFGETKLDGLLAVSTYAWPGAIHEGHGAMQSIIEARADAAQRLALTAILQGEGSAPDASMLKIYRDMCSAIHKPVFSSIEMEIDVAGRAARITIPGLLETAVEPLKNPVTGAEHRARIDLPQGKEFFIAEVASGVTKSTGVVPLEFANSHAHLCQSTFTSAGLSA